MTEPLHDLAGAYAVNALDDDGRERFEAHLGDCEACRAEVRKLQAAVADVGMASTIPPPLGVRQQVLERVGAPEPTPSGGWAVWRRWVGVAAVSALVVAVAALAASLVGANERAGYGDALRDVLAREDAEVFELSGAEGVNARFVYSTAEGLGVFVAEGLADPDTDEVYELWLIDADGAVPVGMVRPDDGAATKVIEANLGGATLFGVTLEPGRGSPEPTSDPVLLGEL